MLSDEGGWIAIKGQTRRGRLSNNVLSLGQEWRAPCPFPRGSEESYEQKVNTRDRLKWERIQLIIPLRSCLKRMTRLWSNLFFYIFFPLQWNRSYLIRPFTAVIKFLFCLSRASQTRADKSLSRQFEFWGCSGCLLLIQSCQVFFLGTAVGLAKRPRWPAVIPMKSLCVWNDYVLRELGDDSGQAVFWSEGRNQDTVCWFMAGLLLGLATSVGRRPTHPQLKSIIHSTGVCLWLFAWEFVDYWKIYGL